MSDEVLVKVDNVSKRFCRSLKRSLWYGLQDLGSEIGGGRHGGGSGLAQTSADVQLRSDEFWAVKDVSFELRRGECLGLIGRNGAGKTTLLRMLNGLIKPDGGRIEMRGRVGALIALGAGFNPILTGRENIYVNAGVLGMSKGEIDSKVDAIIDFAQLREFIDMPIQNYSSGMTVRLGFAIAVNTEPDILLLDEVLAVGDVAFQAKCFNAIADFRRLGSAFILVTHNMHQITRYSDRILYLKCGQVAYCGERERGVAQYLSDINPEETDLDGEHTDWSRCYGSGKVQFTSLRFLNSHGQETTTINPGDPVTLEITFNSQSRTIRPPLLDIVIRDREGLIFHGTNLLSGVHFAHPTPQSGRYIVNFPSLPNNTDYLDFFIASIDSTTQEIFDWKRHIRLLVRRSGSQSGTLDLKPSWQMIPA